MLQKENLSLPLKGVISPIQVIEKIRVIWTTSLPTCHKSLYVLPSSGILLYHMLKFAQYNTTSSHAPPAEAHALVLGIMKNNPNSTSNSPLTNTQNRASPSTEGTMGSYQLGLTKWSTPTEMNASPMPAAPKLRITLCLST